LALAAACLYAVFRRRSSGSWVGVCFAIYLLLMPVITMLGIALYSAATGQETK
jgi:hypothetical protein